MGAERARILLAVSGGADSLALLAGSIALEMRVEVATIDHGLRPESAAEARLVADHCARLGVACHVRSIGLEAGPNLEARARHARYEALEAVRAERALDFIATAHTATDQAETVLMRLVRGASTKGAAGILEKRGRVIRPLLRVTRQQARQLVPGWKVVEDPMNVDPRFLRTRIREDALPALSRAAGFDVTRHLADFARFAAEDEAALAPPPLGAVVLRKELLALPAAHRRRALARMLKEAGIPLRAALLDGAEVAVQAGTRSGLSRTHWIDAAGGVVRVVQRASPPAAAPVEIGAEWREVAWTGMAFQRLEGPPPVSVEWAMAVGPAPLFVRRRRPGDRVRLRERSRKLQDLMVDLRVPAELRDHVPVVTQADGKVIWLPGIWSSPAGGPVHLLARSLGSGQAPEWLVRYRLAKGK